MPWFNDDGGLIEKYIYASNAMNEMWNSVNLLFTKTNENQIKGKNREIVRYTKMLTIDKDMHL